MELKNPETIRATTAARRSSRKEIDGGFAELQKERGCRKHRKVKRADDLAGAEPTVTMNGSESSPATGGETIPHLPRHDIAGLTKRILCSGYDKVGVPH